MSAFVLGVLFFWFTVLIPVRPQSYTLELPFKPIFKMISAHGNVLAAVDKKRVIHVIKLPSGHELYTVDGHNAMNGAFSRDGKWLAILSVDQHVTVYSSKKKIAKKWEIKSRPVYMRFLRNDLLLVGKTIWNVDKEQPVAILKTDFGTVTTAALNKDGTRLAVGSGDTIIRIYNTKTWKVIHRYQGLTLEPFGLAYTTDNSRLALGGINEEITILNASDAKLLKMIDTGKSGVNRIIPVGKHGRMIVQYLDARTDKPLEWRLVNMNTGSSRHICGANDLVSVSGGMIWSFRFKGKTLKVTPVTF